jgi:hypothetical protein
MTLRLLNEEIMVVKEAVEVEIDSAEDQQAMASIRKDEISTTDLDGMHEM